VVLLKQDQGCAEQLAPACPDLITLTRLAAWPVPQHGDAPLEVPYCAPVENFLVLFTSGTTGQPKAISISESLICQRVASVSDRLKFSAASRILMSGLMNNTTGVIFSFGALMHGATLVFPPDRRIDQWPALVARERITHMMLRPVAMQVFVDSAMRAPQDLSSMRVLAYGAAALPQKLLERGRALLNCDWIQGYGLSETYGPFCWLDEQGHRDRLPQRHVYCVGTPDQTLEVRIGPALADDPCTGEVMVRGSALMQGYYDLVTHTVHPTGEWFGTGDFGCFGPTGELILKGRIGSTILSENGHRIYPEEVEGLLGRLDGVDAALLLAIPGQGNLGNQAVACIHGALAREDGGAIAAKVRALLSASLSPEKWPSFVYASVQPFPQNQNDKVVKHEVAKLLAAAPLIRISLMEHAE
jgi:acyl-CoA synthetase (AMP-forming)/AMP-acid ligase II